MRPHQPALMRRVPCVACGRRVRPTVGVCPDCRTPWPGVHATGGVVPAGGGRTLLVFCGVVLAGGMIVIFGMCYAVGGWSAP
jgi:hypothetical protein